MLKEDKRQISCCRFAFFGEGGYTEKILWREESGRHLTNGLEHERNSGGGTSNADAF